MILTSPLAHERAVRFDLFDNRASVCFFSPRFESCATGFDRRVWRRTRARDRPTDRSTSSAIATTERERRGRIVVGITERYGRLRDERTWKSPWNRNAVLGRLRSYASHVRVHTRARAHTVNIIGNNSIFFFCLIESTYLLCDRVKGLHVYSPRSARDYATIIPLLFFSDRDPSVAIWRHTRARTAVMRPGEYRGSVRTKVATWSGESSYNMYGAFGRAFARTRPVADEC